MPYSILFISSPISQNAEAVHKTLFKLSFKNQAVCPIKFSIPLFLIILIIANKFALIWPSKHSESIHSILIPKPFIRSSIIVDHLSTTIFHIVFKISLINSKLIPQFTLAIPFIIFIITLILMRISFFFSFYFFTLFKNPLKIIIFFYLYSFSF